LTVLVSAATALTKAIFDPKLAFIVQFPRYCCCHRHMPPAVHVHF
jgi:hypothetical protein